MVELTAKFLRYFELTVIGILMLAMVFVLLYACVVLFDSLVDALLSGDLLAELRGDSEGFQDDLYEMFGNLLTVLLGLELIHTVKIFFEENRVKLESIMVISVIAIARHVITLDYEHIAGMVLVGQALLLAVFLGGYLLIAKYRYALEFDGEGQGPKDTGERKAGDVPPG